MTTSPPPPPPASSSLHTWGISLNGQDNQNFRFFIRHSRKSLVAINGYGIPILAELLPHCQRCPSILSALLALSARQQYGHTDDGLNSDEAGMGALHRYQAALAELREQMSNLGTADLQDQETLQGVLASALLLSIFTFPNIDLDWGRHASGMLSLIQSADILKLQQTRLGKFVVMSAAHLDISAFSVGRKQRSENAWLNWQLHNENKWRDGATTGLGGEFLPFEISTGYPLTLVTVIAWAAKWADERIHAGNNRENDGNDSRFLLQESMITSWTAPTLPASMPIKYVIALSMAWETIRRAALIYHWRGYGFSSNILEPIRQDRKSLYITYLQDIVVNIRRLIEMCETDEISTGNAMFWPLAVAGCECGGLSKRLSSDILVLLDDMERVFSIAHASSVKRLLLKLWTKMRDIELSNATLENVMHTEYLSLEGITTDMGWSIPLF